MVQKILKIVKFWPIFSLKKLMSSVNLYFNNKSLKIFPIEFKFKAFKLKKRRSLSWQWFYARLFEEQKTSLRLPSLASRVTVSSCARFDKKVVPRCKPAALIKVYFTIIIVIFLLSKIYNLYKRVHSILRFTIWYCFYNFH